MEDIVLLAQQFDPAARHLDPAAVGPQAHVARIEALVPVALVSAQDAADAGAQFRQVERLGEVVVGPEFQSLDLVVEGIAGRNNDHRSRAATLLQLFEQPQSAPAGQHDVQQDAVVIVCGDLVERRSVIGGLLDDVVLPGQCPDHDLPQGGFVFDNKYLHNIFLFLGEGRKSGLKPDDPPSPLKTRLLDGRLLNGAKLQSESERKLKYAGSALPGPPEIVAQHQQ